MTRNQIINSLEIVSEVLFGFADAQGQKITESRAQDAALMGLTLEKIRHELSADGEASGAHSEADAITF